MKAVPQGICKFSGFKVPLSELVRNWNGLFVWHKFVDVRNPQDFVKGVREDEALRHPSPESADTFLTTNEVTADDL